MHLSVADSDNRGLFGVDKWQNLVSNLASYIYFKYAMCLSAYS
jgi:hypothetical protein